VIAYDSHINSDRIAGELRSPAFFNPNLHRSTPQYCPNHLKCYSLKIMYRLKQFFFEESEYTFFHELLSALPPEQYRVFPKVRMEDYILATGGYKIRFADRQRIKSRHVDFMIWQRNPGHFVMGIELDGTSHNNGKARKTDAFKDQVFKSVGLPLIRFKVGTDFTEEIQAILQRLNIAQTPTESPSLLS